MNAISVSCPFVPRVIRHVARDERPKCCMWFAHDCVLATWTGVGDSCCTGFGSRRSEEAVKNLILPEEDNFL